MLAYAASMAAGVKFPPWTGPTLRASAALKIPVTDIFQPMIGVQVVGLIYVFIVVWLLGKRGERRLGLGGSGVVAHDFDRALTPEEAALRQPRLFFVNLLLTVIIIAVMIGGWVDPVVMFMIGVVLALKRRLSRLFVQRQHAGSPQIRPSLSECCRCEGSEGMKTVRIGSGAGYSGDRIEPAVELAERGDIRYLGFECLAERTIALAQMEKRRDPSAGFDPLLRARMQAVLRPCAAKGTRIVTNMGAANPAGAALATAEVARSLGLGGLRIAAVAGDDVLAVVRSGDYPLLERPGDVASLGDSDSVGQRVHGRRRHRGGAPGRRRCRDHRTGGRSRVVPRAACS